MRKQGELSSSLTTGGPMRGARSESCRCERYNLRVEPTAYGGGSRANPFGAKGAAEKTPRGSSRHAPDNTRIASRSSVHQRLRTCTLMSCAGMARGSQSATEEEDDERRRSAGDSRPHCSVWLHVGCQRCRGL